MPSDKTEQEEERADDESSAVEECDGDTSGDARVRIGDCGRIVGDDVDIA